MFFGKKAPFLIKRGLFLDSPNPDKSEDTRYAETHLRFEFSNV